MAVQQLAAEDLNLGQVRPLVNEMSWFRLLLAVLLAMGAGRSWAQAGASPDLPDRYRQDVAGARAQPEYDPHGIRFGSFVMQVNGDQGVGYDSNPFARAQSAEADAYYQAAASYRITSDWGRHAVRSSGSANLRRYSVYRDQNVDEYRVAGGARIDMGDRLTISPELEFAKQEEPRGVAGNLLTAGEPSVYRQFAATVLGNYEGSQFDAEFQVFARQLRYAPILLDGEQVSQRFRASDRIGGRLTLNRRVSPSIAVLVQTTIDESKNPFEEFCCFRNARGATLLAGVRIDPSGLVAGRLALGYRKRDFSGADRSSSGPTYDARIEWYPTELVTVRFSAEQEYQISGIAASSSALVDRQAIAADWEVLRNLLVTVQAENQASSFREVDVRTRSRTCSISATYTPGPRLQFSAFARAQFSSTNRSILASDFDRFRAGLAVSFRL